MIWLKNSIKFNCGGKNSGDKDEANNLSELDFSIHTLYIALIHEPDKRMM